MSFFRSCLPDSPPSSLLISLIQTFQSEQFSQNFEKMVSSFSGNHFFGLEGKMIHVYSVGWMSETKYNSKVKSIIFKTGYVWEDKINLIDVDPYENKLCVVDFKNNDQLKFFPLSSHKLDEVEKLAAPEFIVETFSEIIDFYFAKEECIKDRQDNVYLVVQTQSAILFYNEKKGRYSNVFSIDGTFGDIHKCKFNFFIEVQGEKTILNGILAVLNDDMYKQYLISNFENNEQIVVTKKSTFILDFKNFKRILNVDVSSLDHISLLLSDPEFMISKYVLSMKEESMMIVNSKDVRVLTNHVNCHFYTYGDNSRVIYGRLGSSLSNFEAYKKTINDNFSFRTLSSDFKDSHENFRTLVNDTQLVIVSIKKGTIDNYTITADNRVELIESMNLPTFQPFSFFKKNLVRFVKNNDHKLSVSIEDGVSIKVYAISFSMRNISKIKVVLDLNKQEKFGTSEVQFYQLNCFKNPNTTYRINAVINSNLIISLDFKPKENRFLNYKCVKFDEPVHEIYKSKQFPYNLALSTKNENLIVLNEKLQIQMIFDLKILKQDFPKRYKEESLLDNFNLKHLYDRFYIVG